MKQLAYGHHLRIATAEDASQIYGLLEEARKDADLPNHFNAFTDIQEKLEDFIEDNNNLVLLLCDEHTPLGILAATKIGGPFLFEPFAIELIWWVDPVARKGLNPFRMLDAYEYWARAQKCSYMKLSLLTKFSRSMTKKLNRMYRRKGFDPFETAYFKDLK